MQYAKYEETVRKYIEAYNNFDIDSMLALLHPEVKFKNISSGEINAQVIDKSEFEILARQSAELFKTRSQSIRSLQINGKEAVAEIDFEAVLAKDFPNGLKAGERISLQGKSVFIFKDGLIESIVDES